MLGTRRGASWGDNDMIVFAQSGSSSLWRVRASGGEAEVITVDELEQFSDRRWVDVLPGGEAALVTVWLGGLEEAQIAIESFDTGEREILGGRHISSLCREGLRTKQTLIIYSLPPRC